MTESPFKKIRFEQENQSLNCCNQSVVEKMDIEAMNAGETQNVSSMSEVGIKIMERYGFIKGSGLGRQNQGRTTPVKFAETKNRRGLGFINEQELTSEDEQLQKVDWISSTRETPLNLDDSSIITASRKNTVEDETEFVDPEILTEVLNIKTSLDELDEEKFDNARKRANPFEKTARGVFMNRASVKIANIDAACDFMFTSIHKDNLHKSKDRPCYFADVCAGPGGFTEYILWKNKWHYKGFGFTLRCERDFEIESSKITGGESFESFYGARGDGNIYDQDNIDHFKKAVLAQTDNQGVHFMMADGGFFVEKGLENLQEVFSKRLYLCQCLTALSIVRIGGHFVTKFFDIFTPFSVQLIYLMYLSFDKISVFKPDASRPGNSERYLICKSRKSDVDNIRQFLETVNKKFQDLGGNKPDDIHKMEMDIIDIIPKDNVKSDEKFFDYIVNSNNRLAARQTKFLKRYKQFYESGEKDDERQMRLRSRNFKLWKIPEIAKEEPSDLDSGRILSFLGNNGDDFLYSAPRTISTWSELNCMFGIKNFWHFCVLGYSKRDDSCTLFLSGGKARNSKKHKIFKFSTEGWVQMEKINTQLPAGTILYGEYVTEYYDSTGFTDNKKGQTLHVIDAFKLGETSLLEFSFAERQDLIKMFCKSLNKFNATNCTFLRAKPILPLDNPAPIERPFYMPKKRGGNLVAYPLPGDRLNDRTYFASGTVLFLKSSSDDKTHDVKSTFLNRVQCVLKSGYGDLTLESIIDYISPNN